MEPLNNGYFDLDGDYVFGGSSLGPVFVENYQVGEVNVRDQDAVNPVAEEIIFGVDRETPPVWKFNFSIVGDTEAELLENLRGISAAWRDSEKRNKAGNTAFLRYGRAGRTRRIYGRPRNFWYDPNTIRRGYLKGTCEFHTSDVYTYDDVAQVERLDIVPASSGGFIVPFESPITTLTSGDRQGSIPLVGGDDPAPFLATFYGPSLKPYIYGEEWELRFRELQLNYDQWATVDTRRKIALKSTGERIAGDFTRKSRLSKARLGPGREEIFFGGEDATGTSNVEIEYRPVHLGL